MSSNFLHGVETLELRNSFGQSRNTAAAVLIVIENATTDALEKIERAKIMHYLKLKLKKIIF